MEFHNVKFEEASPLQRRALEGVLRILAGHDISFVGTVAANVMMEVITAEVPDGNLNLIDSYIDSLAVALKRGMRDSIAAKREAQ